MQPIASRQHVAISVKRNISQHIPIRVSLPPQFVQTLLLVFPVEVIGPWGKYDIWGHSLRLSRVQGALRGVPQVQGAFWGVPQVQSALWGRWSHSERHFILLLLHAGEGQPKAPPPDQKVHAGISSNIRAGITAIHRPSALMS